MLANPTTLADLPKRMEDSEQVLLGVLEERIASTRRLLETGSLGRCSRGVAMAHEEIRHAEEEIARLKGKTAHGE